MDEHGMDACDGCMMRRMRNQALFRRTDARSSEDSDIGRCTDARSSEDSDIGRCGPGYAANASSVLLSYVHIVCCAHMSHICVCALSVALCECVLSLLLFVVSRGLAPSPSLCRMYIEIPMTVLSLLPMLYTSEPTSRASSRCVNGLVHSSVYL